MKSDCSGPGRALAGIAFVVALVLAPALPAQQSETPYGQRTDASSATQPLDAVARTPAAELRLSRRITRPDGTTGPLASGERAHLYVQVRNEGAIDVAPGQLLVEVPLPEGVEPVPGSMQPASGDWRLSADNGRSWHQVGSVTNPDRIRLHHQEGLPAGAELELIVAVEVL